MMEGTIVSECTLHCGEPLGVNQAPSSVMASHHSLRATIDQSVVYVYAFVRDCVCWRMCLHLFIITSLKLSKEH